MAPRLARSSLPSSAPRTGKNKTRKRNLDAYAIASHSTTSQRPVRRSRLGEYLDDAPKQKRARPARDDDGGVADSDEEGAPSAPKRRRMAGEDAQGGDEGSDSEGNEWRLGGLRSDDDDSELDSDAAFGDSDEDKFEGFTFRGSKSTARKNVSKSPKQRFMNNDNDDDDMEHKEEMDGEEDDGDEDDFGDEGVDLATMLDDDDDDDGEALAENARTWQNTSEEDDSDEYDSGDEEEDSEVEFSVTSDEDDGQNDEERAARMQDRLDALNKAANFTTATKSAPAALTVDDLLAPSDPASRQQRDTTLNPRKKSSHPQTVSAPLPKRQQDRLNREVANAKAKDQLDRWRDTVIHNRRAEFLSFPLKHTDEVEPMGKDKFIVDNTPQNELEERIQRIMEESGLSTSTNKRNQAAEEDAILAAEGLGTNSLPVEEVMRRRAELRRTRELLFREERKAKRISKIKSKSYRRVHRKERERLAQLEEGICEINDEDAREASDRKRAMARMSTKHRDSKFAKALKETNRGVWDEEARDAVLDEARRREELVRRIRGEEIREGSDIDSDGEDDEGWDGVDGNNGVKEQLNRMKEDSQMREAEGEGKGLQNMRFMRAADERRKAQNDEDVERIRKELAIQDGDEEESDDAAFNDQGLGRAVFGPTAKEKIDRPKAKRGELEETEESDSDDDKSHDEVDVISEKPTSNSATPERPGHLLGKKSTPGKGTSARIDKLHQPASSDWITAETNKPSRNGSAGQQNGKSDWLTTKTNRSKALTKEPTIDISLSEPPTSNAGAQPDKGVETLTHMEYPGGGPSIASAGGLEPVSARNDANRTGIGHNENQRQQAHDYHTRAFAGDDVAASFAAEKSALGAAEDDQVSSSHLPGWGSWTGAGLSKSLRRANAKQKHNPLFKTKTLGVHQADRRDAGKTNVIVSEKQMKRGKGKELLASILPRQFETREQYERSLRVPVGPEWTTKEVFQRSTRPRVVVEKGTVVEALEKPLV